VITAAILASGSSPAAQTTAPTPVRVVLTAVPARLEDASWFGEARPTCLFFNVVVEGTVAHPVTISTQGFGSATLQVASPDFACETHRGDPVALTLPAVGSSGEWIRIHIPARWSSDAGPLTAKILASAPGATAEAEVRLEKAPQGTFLNALLWFCGLVAPAAVAFLVFLGQQRRLAREAEDKALADYIASRKGDLETVFVTYLPVLADQYATEPATWCARLRAKLDGLGVDLLGHHQRRPLYDALARGDRDIAIATLVVMFPDWTEAIKKRPWMLEQKS